MKKTTFMMAFLMAVAFTPQLSLAKKPDTKGPAKDVAHDAVRNLTGRARGIAIACSRNPNIHFCAGVSE